jgi:hypothetical protein
MRTRSVVVAGAFPAIALFAADADTQAAPGQSWIGHHTVTACAVGRYLRTYAHDYRPKFEIDVTSAANDELNMHIQTEGYSCDLRATQRGDSLVIAGGQTCQFQGVATTDFCILNKAECEAGGPRQSCSDEKARGHYGALTAKVTEGELSRQGNDLRFTFTAVAAGCVLAIGHHDNVPVDVMGGLLKSTKCK